MRAAVDHTDAYADDADSCDNDGALVFAAMTRRCFYWNWLNVTILDYTILYYTILYYTILYYTILYYTVLHYTSLYYTILYYTTLYYTILYMALTYYYPMITFFHQNKYYNQNNKIFHLVSHMALPQAAH